MNVIEPQSDTVSWLIKALSTNPKHAIVCAEREETPPISNHSASVIDSCEARRDHAQNPQIFHFITPYETSTFCI